MDILIAGYIAAMPNNTIFGTKIKEVKVPTDVTVLPTANEIQHQMITPWVEATVTGVSSLSNDILGVDLGF